MIVLLEHDERQRESHRAAQTGPHGDEHLTKVALVRLGHVHQRKQNRCHDGANDVQQQVEQNRPTEIRRAYVQLAHQNIANDEETGENEDDRVRGVRENLPKVMHGVLNVTLKECSTLGAEIPSEHDHREHTAAF